MKIYTDEKVRIYTPTEVREEVIKNMSEEDLFEYMCGKYSCEEILDHLDCDFARNIVEEFIKALIKTNYHETEI